jgi:hypothetical protein
MFQKRDMGTLIGLCPGFSSDNFGSGRIGIIESPPGGLESIQRHG